MGAAIFDYLEGPNNEKALKVWRGGEVWYGLGVWRRWRGMVWYGGMDEVARYGMVCKYGGGEVLLCYGGM